MSGGPLQLTWPSKLTYNEGQPAGHRTTSPEIRAARVSRTSLINQHIFLPCRVCDLSQLTRQGMVTWKGPAVSVCPPALSFDWFLR